MEEFPGASDLVQDASDRLKGVPTLRPKAKLPYSTIGMALDYRLRYCFATTPSRDLVAWRGAGLLCARPANSTQDVEVAVWIPSASGEPVLSEDLVDAFFSGLDRVLCDIAPVGRQLDQPQEELLARYCVTLALFEEVFRAPTAVRSSPLLVEEHKTLEDLLAIAQPHWLDDLSNLSRLFHECFDKPPSSQTILNPTFEGSPDIRGADADLIVDSFRST